MPWALDVFDSDMRTRNFSCSAFQVFLFIYIYIFKLNLSSVLVAWGPRRLRSSKPGCNPTTETAPCGANTCASASKIIKRLLHPPSMEPLCKCESTTISCCDHISEADRATWSAASIDCTPASSLHHTGLSVCILCCNLKCQSCRK